MKLFFTLICGLFVFAAHANDTIPILNTVFHGINTLLNITRPVTVVPATPVVVQPVQPVQQVVTPTVPVVMQTIQVTTPGDRIIYGQNGQVYVIRSGVYYRYLPPPKVHHGPRHQGYKHHRNAREPMRKPERRGHRR